MEVVVRIEPVAPAVVPPRALQGARARFGDHAYEAAAVPAILGRVTVGDDLYFADGVHVQVDEAGAAAAFIDDVHAVDAQVLIDGRRTVDGDRRRRPPLREVAIQIGVLDAGQDREEAVHVAALHLNVRQIVDRDGAPARAVRQLHRGDLGGDGDGLGDRAELQRQSAEIPYFGRQEIDVTDGQRAEAGQLDADHVSARIQRGHSKQPDFIRDHRSNRAGVRFGRAHRGAGNSGAGGIHDRARECSASSLRKRSRRAREREQDNDKWSCPIASHLIHVRLPPACPGCRRFQFLRSRLAPGSVFSVSPTRSQRARRTQCNRGACLAPPQASHLSGRRRSASTT